MYLDKQMEKSGFEFRLEIANWRGKANSSQLMKQLVLRYMV